MSYGWEFPINAQGGQREGLNNHGMESFKDDKYDHLAREIIQNSLDAAIDESSTVKVKFTKHSVKPDEIPDVKALKEIFKQLMSEEKDDKYYHFYENALKTLEKNKITILKISDFGTSGLLGVKNSTGDWDSLILNSGSSYKPDGSGGTYGLGKNAPFLLSDLYSIIYSTKTSEFFPGKGLMGVSKLASHFNKDGKTTRGVGYFRNKEDYKIPYTDNHILPSLTTRNESGTDILVLGFTNEEDWVEKTIKSVLKNFFVRILKNGLEVTVEDTIINKNTIDSLMNQYSTDTKFAVAADYYQAYVNQSENCHRKALKIRDLGTIQMTVFLDGSKNRKVLMTRNQGMRIKYLTRFSRMVNFTAVGVVEGEDLNNILRQCEPPAHNEWNAGYYRGELSPREVELLLAEINRVIRDYINSFEEINQSEEIELDGLSDVLGFTDTSKELTQDLNTTDSGFTKVARFKTYNRKARNEEKTVLDPDGNKTKKTKSRKITKEKKSRGKNKENTSQSLSRASSQHVRIVGDPQLNEYTIFFTPKTSGKIRLSIKQQGLNGSKYTRMLKEVTRLDSNKKIEITDGLTDTFEVEKNKQVKLNLTLTGSRMSKLEVKIHEN